MVSDKSKIKMRVLTILSIILVLALVLFIISGAGCERETTTSEDASNLDSELGELDDLYNAIEELEFNETELDELDNLF